MLAFVLLVVVSVVPVVLSFVRSFVFEVVCNGVYCCLLFVCVCGVVLSVGELPIGCLERRSYVMMLVILRWHCLLLVSDDVRGVAGKFCLRVFFVEFLIADCS